MNKKIEELAKQAVEETQLMMIMEYKNFESRLYEKFAELIVRECVHVALSDALPNWGNAASEANAQCVKIAADLKQHFGVEHERTK